MAAGKLKNGSWQIEIDKFKYRTNKVLIKLEIIVIVIV